MQDKLLTLHQVSAATGYHEAYLRQSCIKGKLKAQKPGRDWLVRQVDLEDFLQSPRRHAKRVGKVKPLLKEGNDAI